MKYHGARCGHCNGLAITDTDGFGRLVDICPVCDWGWARTAVETPPDEPLPPEPPQMVREVIGTEGECEECHRPFVRRQRNHRLCDDPTCVKAFRNRRARERRASAGAAERRGPSRPFKYPWDTIQPREEFLVARDERSNTSAQMRAIQNAAYIYGKRRNLPLRVLCEADPEQGVIRVRRVA